MTNTKTSTLLLTILLAACGVGGSGGGGGQPTPTTTASLSFTRVKTSSPSPFIVRAEVLRGGVPVSGQASALQVTLGQGSLGPITEPNPGIYQFTVTPTQTGEHPVTVSFSGTTVTRMPLVLSEVHPDYGQPMSVRGLVNTEGYEDGVTITKDGEYLFVQYGALYFSGFFLFQAPRASGGCGGDRLSPTRCTHPWIDDVLGPIAGPERPGFFTDRIANGKHLHSAASYNIGVDQAPNLAPTTLFYGFKRQADGSYTEPFLIAFDDERDGILNPFGQSFRINNNGTATMLFALNDPADSETIDLDGDGSVDVESLFDVYTTT
ncbi:MAG: hypothetical protein P1V97_34235, partial [Planctomycetota bacterium]|nr:hypothetical protein [Planctomycetota bacterium]